MYLQMWFQIPVCAVPYTCDIPRSVRLPYERSEACSTANRPRTAFHSLAWTMGPKR